MQNEFPNALELEKRLLSALLLEEIGIFPTVTAILTAEDFYRPQHAMIFKALVTVYERGVPPDVSLVAEELKSRGELEKVELFYLHALERLEFTTARAASYAKAIREKARLRAIIRMNREILDMACREVKPSEEILLELEQRRSKLTPLAEKAMEGVPATLARNLEELSERQKNKGDLLGVTTGSLDLNKATNGLRKSNLIILAARPGMGKTALALNIAQAAARQTAVALFSLEMSKTELGYRLMSMASRVDAGKISGGSLDSSELRRVCDAVERLENLNLFWDDTAGLSVSEIRLRAKKLQIERGLGLIVVDYLQLMRGEGNFKNNRVQEVSEISRGLKALAKELDVPVLALSQLNRGVELRAEKRPQLADLRESGSIEQDADLVLFIYRDEYYERDSPEKNTAEIILAKNRHGATGSVRMYFEPRLLTFCDLTKGSV